MFPHKIISGGQTGVDRAALDVALEVGITIGGHLPRGRKDEKGDVLPDKYANMQETDTDDVNVRTELNLQDSDATLIFSHGALFGGSAYTQRMARQHEKPCLHIDFDQHDADQAELIVKTWLSDTQPRVLNVAGPRASDDPEIYSKAKCVLASVLSSGRPPAIITKVKGANMAEITLVWLLRIAGVILLTAVIPTMMPFTWMKEIHQLLGMGELPEGTIIGYLTRSLSAMYAMHGALVLFVSLDVRRFLPVVMFLAVLGIVFGAGMLVLDVVVGMPPYWVLCEGPFIVVLGGVLFWLSGRVQE